MALGVILGVGLAGAWLWRSSAHPTGARRVLIISPEPSQYTNVNLGLETLIADHFEVLAGLTVTHAAAVPAPAILRQLPPDMPFFRFQGRRDGQRLVLSTQWTTPAELLAGHPWIRSTQPPMDPDQAMEAWVAHWPMERRHRIKAELYPRSPQHFWDLLEAMAIQDDREATAHLSATQALAEAEPMCATAWTTLGDHLYRSLWVDPAQAGIGLNSRTHKAFQRAVSLVPGHPRATFLWSLMLTDTGNQGIALRALDDAVHLRPRVPDLYLGLTYAGRTSGLLAGAHSAMSRRQALLFPLAPTSYWTVETTDLYLGDWAAFEQDLLQEGSPEKIAEQFLSDQVKDVAEALQGARDIVAETISDHADVRRLVRDKAMAWGTLTVEKIENLNHLISRLVAAVDKISLNNRTLPLGVTITP